MTERVVGKGYLTRGDIEWISLLYNEVGGLRKRLSLLDCKEWDSLDKVAIEEAIFGIESNLRDLCDLYRERVEEY